MPRDPLTDTLYAELRKLARARIHRLRPGQTWQPTDLVHEVYLRMRGRPDIQWQSRAHFFGAAARAMRDVLVDHARFKGAYKRGGQCEHVAFIDDLDAPLTLTQGRDTLELDEFLSLNQTLERLRRDLPEHAEIVLLRVFAGLTVPQIADMRGVSVSTIERYWRFARAWLQTHMDEVPTALNSLSP